MPIGPLRKSAPTWVQSIDTETLAGKNKVIVLFFNGQNDEFRIDDPIYHYMNFKVDRRAKLTLPRNPVPGAIERRGYA